MGRVTTDTTLEKSATQYIHWKIGVGLSLEIETGNNFEPFSDRDLYLREDRQHNKLWLEVDGILRQLLLNGSIKFGLNL